MLYDWNKIEACHVTQQLLPSCIEPRADKACRSHSLSCNLLCAKYRSVSIFQPKLLPGASSQRLSPKIYHISFVTLGRES